MRNRTENQVTLALIRHGQTPANSQRRYLGKTDEPLSQEGRNQLLAYKEQSCYPRADCLFSSPMKRCMETARILYPGLCPLAVPEWEEMDFGLFEYKNYEELKDDARYQAWIDSGGTLSFPEGETREAFLLRCQQGLRNVCGQLQRMTEQNAGMVPQAAMIVHGGTIMALLSTFGGKEYFDCQVSNGRGYLCKMGWSGEEDAEKTRIQIEVVTEI